MRHQITNFTSLNQLPSFDQLTEGTASAVAAASTTLASRFEDNSDRVLDAVVDANRRVVEFAVSVSDRVTALTPAQFPVELPFTGKLPTFTGKLPTFTGKLPTAAETGERYLDFVERAVSVNRDFNERIVSMLKGDVTSAVEQVIVNASATAKKTATKKTVAKKTVAKKAVAKRTVAKKATARTVPVRKTEANKTVAK
jgi:hypothetical protein